MKAVTTDKILQRAARLFFAEGFAVGIDRVTLECDTAKMTIYGGFKSKDGLICAILREVRSTLAARIAQVIQPALAESARLQSVFNVICYGMNDPVLKIGLCVRALAEFPGSDHPVHRAALELERALLQHLQPEARNPSGEDSTQAQQLLLIAKGCFLMAPLLGLQASRQLALELATLRLQPRKEPDLLAATQGGGLFAPANL